MLPLEQQLDAIVTKLRGGEGGEQGRKVTVKVNGDEWEPKSFTQTPQQYRAPPQQF